MQTTYQVPRNALALMLLAQIAVIAPHLPRMPYWLIAICAACIGWRVIVYQGRWSYPGRWMKVLLVFGGFAGVGFGYGSLLGLEPWVAILIVAFVLKLLEMHQKKDAYTVIILGYFVALTEFLFEQSIPYTLYMYACITLITASLVALNQTKRNLSPKKTVIKASQMLLQAIPLMVVLFVLFPRIAPLWTVPLESNVARTGVSDNMSPGTIADLVQSDELAFRATFDGEIPAYRDLYWRGLVLSRFDGTSWLQERPGLYGRTIIKGDNPTGWEDHLEYVGDPVAYSIIMEPTNQNWIFSLMLPEPTETKGLGLVRDHRFYSFREVRNRFRYEVTSYLDYRTDANMGDFWKTLYTRLPAGNPRTRALADELRGVSTDNSDYVRRVLQMFAVGDYAYTLRPPLVEGEMVDGFLFDTRRGFCEHFASSFVYMMRAGGVPARVVVGYQGGEFNRIGNYVAVRQYDAHAWSEVWIDGEGWRRVDPTSIVAPERINQGLESAVSDEDTFLADVPLSFMKINALWFIELRLQMSAISHYWEAWVVGYTPSVQMNLLTEYFGDLDRKRMGMILLGAFFGLFAIIGFILLLKRTHAKLAPVEQEYLAYCRFLERLELPRHKGEGPLDYAARVSEARPDLEPAVRAVTNAYVKANYIDNTPGEAVFLKKAVRRLRLAAV